MSDAPVRPAWPQVPLSDVAEVAAGVTLGRNLPVFGTVELPYLRVANVQDGYLDLSNVKTVRVRPSEIDRYRLRPGDVLMNEGGDFDKLGRGAVWRGELSVCLHQNVVLRARCDAQRLLPGYLAAVAASPHGRTYFARVSKQSTNIAHLGLRQLAEFPVPLPSLDVQQRILDTTAAAEDAADASRRLAAKLARVREGELQGLLAPAGAPFTQEAGGWPRAQLSDVAEVAAGVTLGRELPVFGTVELPYLRVANVQDGYLDLSEVKTVRVRPGEVDRYRLQPGDVVLSEGNANINLLGRATLWTGEVPDCLHQNIVLRVRCDPSRLLPAFLVALTRARDFRRYVRAVAKQTSIAHLGISQLAAYPVPLPPLEAQQRIVDTLAGYDRRIRAELARAEKHTAIRDGLLDEFFTGRSPAAA